MNDDLIKSIAKFGAFHHREALLAPRYNNIPKDSQKASGAKHVAYHTNSQAHLDKLINHPNAWVRAGVASNEHAQMKHLDKLVNDPNHWVREAVAYKTNDHKHLNKLVNDPHPWVREAVAARTQNKAHLDKLVHDSNDMVRVEVAKRGYKDHHEILLGKTGENLHVLDSIARTSRHVPHLERLANASPGDIGVLAHYHANERLNRFKHSLGSWE